MCVAMNLSQQIHKAKRKEKKKRIQYIWTKLKSLFVYDWNNFSR